MLTDQVESTSSRNASNSSSARSTSSTSSTAGTLPERPQHRPGEQEPLVEQRLLRLGRVELAGPAGRLERAQVQDLAREVPVVERLAGVDPLVALQPDQRHVVHLGERLGQRRLAGAGLALEQQRPLHLLRRGRRPSPARRRRDSRSTRARRSRPGGESMPATLLSGRLVAGWGRVHVAAGGEVAALDLGVRVGAQVVACSLVALADGEHARPSASRPSSTGCPGTPSYAARASTSSVSGSASTRRTTSRPTSGRSTRVTRHRVCSPCRA